MFKITLSTIHFMANKMVSQSDPAIETQTTGLIKLPRPEEVISAL